MRAHRARAICKKTDCINRAAPALKELSLSGGRAAMKVDAKAMMFCRRCTLSCYCNAQCQKQAWSKDDVPHKPLCNAVDELRRKTGLDNDALWKDVLTRPGVKAEDLFAQICGAKGVDSAMREAIAFELRRHDTAMWAAGL
ncbi:hypothetical protein FB451DRAFT_1220476 [Mycena latifolia]|nr:hypothetical protein FB451DRAFT_1220476 [Mycena latifolia]